jgi:hypothetical protein
LLLCSLIYSLFSFISFPFFFFFFYSPFSIILLSLIDLLYNLTYYYVLYLFCSYNIRKNVLFIVCAKYYIHFFLRIGCSYVLFRILLLVS